MKFASTFIVFAVLISSCFSQYQHEQGGYQQGGEQYHQSAPAPAPAPVPAPVPVPVPGFGLGFGGLGFGGIGIMNPFLLRRCLIFPLSPLCLIGGIGKRDVEEISRNVTTCTFVKKSSMIRCSGQEQFECGVEARLSVIRDVTVKPEEWAMVSENMKTNENREVGVIRIFSRAQDSLRKWTIVNPKNNNEIVLSIYSSPAISEPGFFVREMKCFDRIDSVVRTMGVNRVRFEVEL